MLHRSWLIALAGILLTAWFSFHVLGQPPSAQTETVARQPAKNTPTVKDFGATGDGTTDDTQAIQRAVDSSAGTIAFPAGTYVLTRPIVIDLQKTGWSSIVGQGTARVVMKGQGAAFRFVGTHGGTADPKTVQAQVWQRERTPLVQNIEIVGAHEEADGIEADGTMQLTIDGAVVREARHAVHLVRRNRNVLITGCHFYNNSGIGVFYDHVDLHQSNIVGSHISYNGGGGVVTRGGGVRNLHITGCDIESNMAVDGPPTANVLIECGSGTTAEVAIVGCTIQHNSKAKNSANIRVFGEGEFTSRGEKQLRNCGHITIADNVMSDVMQNVHLNGARGVTIVGNTFWQGYTHNLLVENCSQVVVGANMMERNPMYGYTSEANNAIVFENSRDCTIQGLHIHNVKASEAGIALRNCQRMHLNGCTVLDCEKIGLLLDNVKLSRISDCLIRDDREDAERSIPLQMVKGTQNVIVDNTLSAEPSLEAGDSVVRDNIVVGAKE